MSVSFTDASYAEKLDGDDPLARFREQFHIPRQPGGADQIYLVGNSLGLQPKRTAAYLEEELLKWRELAVQAHFTTLHPWMPYHEFLSEPMGAIVGASKHEVVVMNSLTINLHLMMVSFYRPTAARHRILIESHAFPSDLYAVESQIRLHGFGPAQSLLVAAPRVGEQTLRLDDLLALIEREGHSIAMVLLPGVQYYSGQLLDLEAITSTARAQGCHVGFDLAHAAGNVPLSLHDWGVDFACWCSYKYLNAGPGSVGACFVHERHAQAFDLPRLAGWWGHDKTTRFDMDAEFRPMAGVEGWQVSNPPILSLAAIRASLDVFEQAGGMTPLREKSVRLTGYLASLVQQIQSVTMITPAKEEERGCQISLKVNSPRTTGREVFGKLEAAGVVCDWRQPDVIRVAPVPLYNRYADVLQFAQILRNCV
ncbi:MAG: kynureninase [Acidobacteriota bacterium]